MIAFVSGGARSGKSRYAESLARTWQAEAGGELYYLATAEAASHLADTEMARRIARHRHERGEDWTTLEEPVSLDVAIEKVADQGTVLLDCLTLWASQVLYASSLNEGAAVAMLRTVMHEVRSRALRLVVVSNDVNEGLPIRAAEVQRYVAFLQHLHHQVVTEAEVAVQVIAGCPVAWKGSVLEKGKLKGVPPCVP
ncbi:bifunctional adenosylcobinamide kinase/adenosylcobinamide-phosphate guanylyltransferase [Modicisalibacter luteus]|uniref:Bifunctional adenosylcobalamin biosynthesis protein n=1 Tax=Modicisalibacter luteus TaxID=453962 RepID=A0ABV7M1K4_9GAMM|nr:bifunctional adenosylcobinamide kinase/adenosylcobinamide-phosphate guanylyltransferase [Halomonas lutea]GHB09040.1 adenosylcobinamide kinase/adenosylcobinamide phosphate guanyltransferase [Halomonas lutea]